MKIKMLMVIDSSAPKSHEVDLSPGKPRDLNYREKMSNPGVIIYYYPWNNLHSDLEKDIRKRRATRKLLVNLGVNTRALTYLCIRQQGTNSKLRHQKFLTPHPCITLTWDRRNLKIIFRTDKTVVCSARLDSWLPISIVFVSIGRPSLV